MAAELKINGLAIGVVGTMNWAQGNAAFSSGDFVGAIKHFSDAIELDPTNHVLYSNRSAAQASLQQFKDALEDAQKVVEMKPDWPKGYSRLGAAHFGLHDLDEAKTAYKKGLELDPGNELLQQGLRDVQAASSKANNPFANPNLLGKLMSNPKTAQYMGQPDFMMMVNDVQNNPQNMSKYLQDPRMLAVLEVGLGIGVMNPGSMSDAMDTNGVGSPTKKETQDDANVSEAMEEDPPHADESQSEDQRKKAEADKEKESGNAAYKKKNFEEAIQHYTKAHELWDKDISYLTNRAAVYLEMGDVDKCIEDCNRAIELGREVHADYKLIARALTRKGRALVKKGLFEEAREVFNKSLTEHRNADTLKALQETEREIKAAKEAAYIDLDKCAEEKENGNQAFKKQDFPTAVRHYSEALKRGPAGVYDEAYKLYSNRAACYTKLGAMHDALKDAEECIELKPDFLKGYSRKGHVQYFMKEYEKALETYQAGLEIDKDNEEMKDGIRNCMNQINRIQRGDATEEELKERREKAMADPEIQGIMSDPVMAQVLRDFEQDPKSAQKHLRNPEIMSKLNKLVTSGIIQLK